MSEEQSSPKADNLEAKPEEIQSDGPSQEENPLEKKIQDQARHLNASKAEAIRLKQENEALKAAFQGSQTPKVPQQSIEVDPEELETFKKFVAAAGIPTQAEIQQIKSERYKEQQDVALSKFLDEHPEYKKDNDVDDSSWSTLVEELSQYKQPTNPSDWYKLLNKAHRSINSSSELERGKALGIAQANMQEERKMASMSGSQPAKPSKKLTPDQKAAQDAFASIRPNVFSGK